jgi:selenium metabolism protein YedF
LTKKALLDEPGSGLKILVDNDTAKENVGRFAGSQGRAISVVEKGGEEFEINIAAGDGAPALQTEAELLPCPLPDVAESKNVVYVATNSMGTGSEELGLKLMRGFLRTWIDVSPLPWRMIFINAGVMLTTQDEEAVDAISMLQDKGVEILSCGTCLEHFHLDKKLKVGKATNMYEVIESLNAATKVISPD